MEPERTQQAEALRTKYPPEEDARLALGYWADLRPNMTPHEMSVAVCLLASRAEPLARHVQDLLAERDRLRAENAELRAAMKPFTEWSKGWHPNWPDFMGIDETNTDDCPTLGDCRRAAELLAKLEAKAEVLITNRTEGAA